MTITARFASTCPVCSARIAIGSPVEWTKGSPARHTACTDVPTTSTVPGDLGSMRHLGSGNPGTRSSARATRYGSRYTRFSSGAEVFTNHAGRCLDAPCCGCCS